MKNQIYLSFSEMKPTFFVYEKGSNKNRANQKSQLDLLINERNKPESLDF